MNNNLLYVKFRISCPKDLAQCLTDIIKRDYFQPASLFQDDLQSIRELRHDVEQLQDEHSDQGTQETLIKYNTALNDLRKKFPDDEIEFQWYGTLGYSPSGPFGCRSIRYEIFNVLYQLASLYSQLGISQSRHSDEGLKKACSYFQHAAGCFELLNEQIQATHSDNGSSMKFNQWPSDFHGPTLKFLHLLMLAQAQEVIWQKAVGNPDMKNSVIARLSCKTSEYYSSAAVQAHDSDAVTQDWINHVAVKSLHFKAAAHLRSAYTCQESFKYGDQVAHLQAAAKYCRQAAANKRYVTDFVIEDLQGLTETINSTLRVAEKDNDLIYLKPVPHEQELSPIQGASMVKSLVPQAVTESYTSPSTKPLFDELIPYLLIQIAQAFRERQDTYITDKLYSPINALNKMINSFITERNLPASIDAIQKPDGLPESIIQHSREIMDAGGTRNIDMELTRINQLAIDCTKVLAGCQERLKRDAEEDNLLRSQQGTSRWTRASSQEAAAPLVVRINKMRDYLEQAKRGDEVILRDYEEIKGILQIYCAGYDELVRYIPSSNFIVLDPSINQSIMALRDAIGAIDIHYESRRQFCASLEAKARDNNILPILLDKYKNDKEAYHNSQGIIEPKLFEPIYESHLKIFQPDLEFLKSENEKQQALETKIDALNQQFIAEYATKSHESQMQRQEVLQKLERAFTKHLQLLSDLNEGSQFYAALINNGNALLKECDEYVSQRRLEGRQLEEQLNRPHFDAPSMGSIVSPTASSVSIDNQDTAQMSSLQHELDDVSNGIRFPGPRGTWDPSKGIKFS